MYDRLLGNRVEEGFDWLGICAGLSAREKRGVRDDRFGRRSSDLSVVDELQSVSAPAVPLLWASVVFGLSYWCLLTALPSM